MPPREVVLDTNFLLVPFQFKIDVLAELEYLLDMSHVLVVSSGSLGELRKIARQRGADGMAAKLALRMLDANSGRIRVIRSSMPVDDWIVEHAEKRGAIVCTNDRELRRRLKEVGAKIVTLRGRAKIGFV